ncbi:7773_t:CDS:2 [Diversispora eburnea]|uniref:7773_t:CDS:1 n=1 Tax=Diversispora eburnea TaxID=1213867 RepID=A0A9N8YPD7_9GLOM|nr:7773_t:CDS:2 [Diversispora eburnea]
MVASNVQIALRIRALSAEELLSVPARLQKNVLSTSPFAPNQVIVQGERKQVFSFDNVFAPEVSQKEIYDRVVMNMIDKVIEGYNVTILSYGHASSGKSHTLGISDGVSYTRESKGIIPRAMSTLISYINSAQYKKRKYSMRISFVEINDEKIIDLLSEDNDKIKPQILIRDESNGQILWSGLQEIKVNSLEEAINILSRGMLNRQINTSRLNDRSSHRHTIFSVTLSQQKFIPVNGDSVNSSNLSPSMLSSKQFSGSKEINKQYEGDWVTVTSKLHFVDLSWKDMDKDIPKSIILPISHVISNLGKKTEEVSETPRSISNAQNCPPILKEYLGGNAKVLVISCVSPAAFQVKETINTLEFATQARNNKDTTVIHQEIGWYNVEHLQDLVLKLRAEVKTLQENGTNSLNTPVNEKQRRRSSILANILVNSNILQNEKDSTNLDDKISLASLDLPKILEGETLNQGLGPIIEEYEKSILSLENQLSHVRAALAYSENALHLQEDKLKDTEETNKQNMHTINDLKNHIAKLNERKETTEIEEIESRDDMVAELGKKIENLVDEITYLKETQTSDSTNSTNSFTEQVISKEVILESKVTITGKEEESEVSNAELLVAIQKLHKRLAKFEEEAMQNQQLIDTLEATLIENEDSLIAANKKLSILQNREDGLLKQIKALNSRVEEANDETENAKSDLFSAKQTMERTLVEERKSKENLKFQLKEARNEVENKKAEILLVKQEEKKIKEKAEMSRITLENELERLLSKKKKFGCF